MHLSLKFTSVIPNKKTKYAIKFDSRGGLLNLAQKMKSNYKLHSYIVITIIFSLTDYY